jgi:putative hydrolase of the HAD superfamily
VTRQYGVIWDFDGTLAERPGLWSGCLLEVLDEEDPGHRISEVQLAAHMRTGFPWHNPDRAHPEWCEPDAWWAAMTGQLAAVCERVGYPRSRALALAAQMRSRYTDGTHGWRLYPDTHSALQRLRDRGCRQAVLSNHVPELAPLLADLGLLEYVDPVLTSALTGFEKPHPSAYAAARSALPGIANLWMIGDNAECDVRGPERHGITGILVQRSDRPRPERVARCAGSLTEAVGMVIDGTGSRRPAGS